MQRAEGTWGRVGEGGITFSREFLTFSGEQRGEDGTAYSDMERKFGIWIRLSLRTYTVVWYVQNRSCNNRSSGWPLPRNGRDSFKDDLGAQL